MSSKGYATPLRLDVGANPLLQRLYLGMTLCTVIVLLLLPLPFIANLLAVILLLLFVWRIWQRRAELGGRPVQLLWDGEDRWWWTSGGVEQAVSLLPDSYLISPLAVLNFRVTGTHHRRAVVLTPAVLGEENFRRMLVRFQITPKNSSPV